MHVAHSIFRSLLLHQQIQAWASEATIRKTNRIPQQRPRTDEDEGGKEGGEDEEEEDEEDDDEVIVL